MTGREVMECSEVARKGKRSVWWELWWVSSIHGISLRGLSKLQICVA